MKKNVFQFSQCLVGIWIKCFGNFFPKDLYFSHLRKMTSIHKVSEFFPKLSFNLTTETGPELVSDFQPRPDLNLTS